MVLGSHTYSKNITEDMKEQIRAEIVENARKLHV